jgi:hypothetical protein
MAERYLRCFANRDKDGGWQAVCIDLDIAAQGRSLHEVRKMLSRSISMYLDEVGKEDAATRQQLLRRQAPWSVRARYHMGKATFSVMNRLGRSPDRNVSQTRFHVPCHT